MNYEDDGDAMEVLVGDGKLFVFDIFVVSIVADEISEWFSCISCK